MHVEFTLTGSCPVMCAYCPQLEFLTAYSRQSVQTTSFEDFRKMLSNVGHVTKYVDFSGYSDPLLNPHWHRIFKHTVDQGYNLSVFSTLFGASPGDVDHLLALPIHQLYIHVTPRPNHLDCYRHCAIRCAGSGRDVTFVYFTEEEKRVALEALKNIDGVKCEEWLPHSRAGKLNTGRTYLAGSVECSEERYHCNVVLPNGDVYVCCMDFKLEYKLGNLLNTSLASIQDSEALFRFRARMQTSSDCMCNDCIYAIPR